MKTFHEFEPMDASQENRFRPVQTITDAAPEAAGGGRPRPKSRMWMQELTAGTWNAPHYYQSRGNGYVQCTINDPSQATKCCLCWGYVRVRMGDDVIYAYATGGNLCYFGILWSPYHTANPNSFLLPVFPGYSFELAVENMGGSAQQVNVHPRCFWVSDDDKSADRSLLMPVRRDPDPDFTPPPLPQAILAPSRLNDPPAMKDRQSFIAILERLTNKPIGAEMQQRLLALGPLF